MGQTASAMSYRTREVKADDGRERQNNNLKEETIQEVIEIGAYQDDYKPFIVLNNQIDSIKKLNLI